ncbi:hypothetical protein L7F22_005617 [Adiantum nelumboides]|nr:hypothetical protein [Adiantum nelumboides]
MLSNHSSPLHSPSTQSGDSHDSLPSPTAAAPPTTTTTTTTTTPRFRGVRKRKWGKWVAEIREPRKRSRIWLGSYFSPLAAALAFDVATFCLRGPSAKMNLPHLLPPSVSTLPCGQLSPKSVQQLSLATGSKADQEAAAGAPSNAHSPSLADQSSSRSLVPHAGTGSKRPPPLSITPSTEGVVKSLSSPTKDVPPFDWTSGATLDFSPNPTIAQIAAAMLVEPPLPLQEQDPKIEASEPSDSSLWYF